MNVCVFSGNLGKDPEVKNLPSGTSLLEFSLAVKQGYGEYESTFWLNCKAFKREKLAQYLSKGSRVTVSGELNNRKYQDKDGNDRWSLELRVLDLDLPPKPKHDQAQPQPQQPAYQPAQADNSDAPF